MKHKPIITRDEFVQSYGKRSGVTYEQLQEMGRIALPCHCGESICHGWSMENVRNIFEFDLQFIPTEYHAEIEAMKCQPSPS